MTNPFFEPSTLPYALPPFDRISDADYAPAFERGLAEQLAEIEAIAEDPRPATFDNTVIPLQRSGQLLSRVEHVFFNKSSSDSNDLTSALEMELAPQLAAHSDAIRLDPRLFARIQAVYDDLGTSDTAHLTPEEIYLVERLHSEFSRAGAGLGDDDKQRLRDLNSELSTLTTRFEKNLLADTNELAITVDDVAELDGLSSDTIASLAAAATERGLEGGYLIALTLFTGHPLLASLTNRDLRGRIMTASRSRGSRGGEHDNRQVLLDIVRLRAERAALLGFPSHAAYVTAGQTAGSPEAVRDLLGRLAPPAARNARAEQDDLARVAASNPAFPEGAEIAAHDWAYYTEKVRSEKYDFDASAMRPYFEADRVLRDGVFYAATQLYGLRFEERPDLVAYHPEARVFEVSDDDGSPVGLFVLDLYTRDSKRGGAWMNPLVSESALLGHLPVVVNNLNVAKPPAGSPTLLTLDEVTTMFHEFGHALHGLVARVTYPYFSGTNVFRDFVEFPSQVNEMWLLWPEVLGHYAFHFETGEPMPAELVDRLTASEGFNQGFETSEYLAATLLDQAWHALTVDEAAGLTSVDDVAVFEASALAAVGLDNPAVPTRYSSTYFAHTFSGGYDAGYYSYIWSEVLDADTVEWFAENGGLTRANGDRFRSRLLGVGGSKDPLAAYRDFRGRDAAVEPLLVRRRLQ
ncbi:MULTISPECIES: M3 family metallopeptidase [unclassified Frondihabitans]|uniref:M3 family metallopeptidase n=1 Tax=unclassified Frondihabitans TaxID=2626248 RepID=UPI000F50F702|nr:MULTISPECIES: M3 family metallopeptidase [unclassified Frondihabitans]RPE76483.1 peptidyl-dipeptidase Dcp [Frondihabitans sp. PhB153]RPF05242.1 peptidyl-dipeptidase Dcp [Frondihabitans sp. PhB161]